MQHKKYIQWLYSELPEWVKRQIISAETSRKLRDYYGAVDQPKSRNIALIVCGILGSALIGAGVILLFAHNWDALNRPLRAVLSFTPLVTAQALAGWVLWKKTVSTTWREGSGVFLMLAVSAAIALIAQTYQIPGDLGNFLLTWMLLSFPIVYIMRSTTVALLYLAGITAWAGYAESMSGQALLFWSLAALMVPCVWMEIRRDRYTMRSVLLRWGFALCLTIALGIVLEKIIPGLWIIIYSGLFAVMYLVGQLWFRDIPKVWQKPLFLVGSIGIACHSFLLTYRWPWHEIGWHYYRTASHHHELPAIIDYVLAAGLPIAAISLLMYARRRVSDNLLWLFGVAPLIAVIGYSVAAWDQTAIMPMLLFNGYVFVLGLGVMISALRQGRAGKLNAGLLLLAAVILARFFDSDLNFLIRGLAFIGVGLGFLIANLVLARQSKGGAV